MAEVPLKYRHPVAGQNNNPGDHEMIEGSIALSIVALVSLALVVALLALLGVVALRRRDGPV